VFSPFLSICIYRHTCMELDFQCQITSQKFWHYAGKFKIVWRVKCILCGKTVIHDMKYSKVNITLKFIHNLTVCTMYELALEYPTGLFGYAQQAYLWWSLYFNKTHSTVTSNWQFVMVTISWNLNTSLCTCLKE